VVENERQAQRLHHTAMSYCDSAAEATREAEEYRRVAYQIERRAAELLAPTTAEPSRSILHRSAASLAMECGEYQAAVKIATKGLEGAPPPPIAAELRDVLDRAMTRLDERRTVNVDT